MNFHILIKKMGRAIREKYGQVLLYTEEQKVSDRTGHIYTEYRLSLSVTREKYNEMHPGKELDEKLHPGKYATIPLKRTISVREMFLYVLGIWKKLESGEMYEEGKREQERIRSGRHVKRRKGRGGSTGVLQDASVGEELPGGISGSERGDSEGESEGDTEEA